MRIRFAGPMGLIIVVIMFLLPVVTRYIDQAKRDQVDNLNKDTIKLALLQPYDLPSGWLIRSTDIQDRAAKVSFYKRGQYNTSGVAIYQSIEMYATRDEVSIALDVSTTYFLSTNDPNYNLSGLRAEEVRVNCRPFRVNDVPLEACTAVGVYGTNLMTVGGGIYQEKWLSHDEFLQVILAADARLVDILE